MPHVEKHPAGDFCWIELMTPDQNAAKTFYAGLFGWLANDTPIGPGQVYTIFQLQGRNVGACFGMRAEESQRGIPPHWHLYAAVDDADQAAAKATGLGGTILEGPFDVFDAGRMAVVRDPTGAVLSVFQSKRQAGLGITGEPNTFCWADLITQDPARAKDFYAGLFGWEVLPGEKDTSGYLHIKNGDQFIGGIPPVREQTRKAPPHWMSYFYVEDVDASTKKAQELGARVYAPPMTIEGVGRMAVVADPQGAVFSLFKSARA